jgi:predicted secreted protein
MKNKILTLVLTVLLFSGMLVLPSCGTPAATLGTYKGNFIGADLTLELKANNAYTLTMDSQMDVFTNVKQTMTGNYGDKTTITSGKTEISAFGQSLQKIEMAEEDLAVGSEFFNLIIDGNYAFALFDGPIVLIKDGFTPAEPTGVLHTWGGERFFGNAYDISVEKDSTVEDLINVTSYVVIHNNGDVVYGDLDDVLGVTGVKFGTIGTYDATYFLGNGTKVVLKVNVSEAAVAEEALDLSEDLFDDDFVAKGTTLETIIGAKTVKINGSEDAPEAITTAMISGYNKDKLGAQTVTLTYTKGTKTVKEVYYITVFDSENIAPVEYLGAPYFIVAKDTAKSAMTENVKYMQNNNVKTATVAFSDESIALTGYDAAETGLQAVTVKYTYATDKTFEQKVMFYVYDTDSNPIVDYALTTSTAEASTNILAIEADEEGAYDLSGIKLVSTKIDGTDTVAETALTAAAIGYDSAQPKVFLGDFELESIVENMPDLVYTIEKTITVGTYTTTVNLYIVLLPYSA